MPQCTQCQLIKPVDAFNKNKRAKSGRYAQCKECRKRYHESRPRVLEPTVTHKICRLCKQDKPAKAFSRATRDSTGLHSYCRDCHAARDVASKYGIPLEEVVALLATPEAECPICLNHKTLVFDHSHASGKYRQRICGSCNLLLGHAMDDVATLQRAVEYLLCHT